MKGLELILWGWMMMLVVKMGLGQKLYFLIQKQQIRMEEALEEVSNQHRTAYYSTQLKVMDISQNLRTMGMRLTQNQLKTLTTEGLSIYCMLENIYNQNKMGHIYQIVRQISVNYNSIIAILLERIEKSIQKQILVRQSIEKQPIKMQQPVCDQELGQGNILKQLKKNRLGGVHLYNQNYAKYIEDQRILQQIRIDKQNRLYKKKMQLLRDSIMQEINHKTDVEESPAKNDQITHYILETKNKNSVFNYVSYQAELQEILVFFQHSQTEANDFLLKKGATLSTENEAKFSFADFQRELQFKNSEFKKVVIQKMKDFLQKYRVRQQQMQKYVARKQLVFQKLQQRFYKGTQIAIQTQFNFDEYLKKNEVEMRDWQMKCNAMQNLIRKEQYEHVVKESMLNHEVVVRESQIQKLNGQIHQMEVVMDGLKKTLRDQRSRKAISGKDDSILRTEKTIQRQMEREVNQASKEKNNTASERVIQQHFSTMNSANKLRKTSNMSHSWRRKVSNDATSFISSNQLEDGQDFQRHQRKKVVRYNIEQNKSQIQGDIQKTQLAQSCLSKMKKIKSSEYSVQTDCKDDKGIINQQKSQRVLKSSKYVARSQKKLQALSILNSINNLDKEESKENDKIGVIDKSNKALSSLSIKQESQRPKSKKINSSIIDSKQQTKSLQKNDQKIQIKTASKNLQIKQQINKNQKKLENRPQSKKKVTIQLKQRKQVFKIDPLTFSDSLQKQRQGHRQLDSATLELQSRSMLKPQCQKKEQLVYKIFSVAQEQGEQQRQSYKNTQRSDIITTLKSGNKLQTEIMQKLNKQLNKIRSSNICTYEHLYSLVIYPHTNVKTKLNSFDWKNDRNSTEASQPFKERQCHKIVKLFDNLPKLDGPQNQIKKQRVKNWKKKIMQGYRSNLISDIDLQQIISVISYTSKNSVSVHQEATTSPPACTTNRTSLPDIMQKPLGYKQTSKHTKGKIKFRSSFSQQIGDISPIECQLQQRLQNAIKFQAMESDFPNKFRQLHKKCGDGPLCRHITRYLQTMLKFYQLKSEKSMKKSAIFHIQHIGKKMILQEQTQELLSRSLNKSYERPFLNKQNINKDIFYDIKLKSKPLKKLKGNGSQELTLPAIQDSRSSIHLQRT